MRLRYVPLFSSSLINSALTGFGIAALSASSTDSHTTPDSAARDSFFQTSMGCGVMLSLKWVKPCFYALQGFRVAISSP